MDAYSALSRAYDLVLEPMNAPVRATARRLWPPTPGSVVVDAGCGTGAALADYREAGCEVIGVDPSPAMLAQARKRLGPHAELHLGDGTALPVADQCADTVLVSLVLHSLSRQQALTLLAEACRVLAADGRIIVTDFGSGRLRFPRGYLTRGFTGIAEVVAGPTHARNCLRYLRAGGLASLADAAGLRITASRLTAGGNIVLAVLEPAAKAGR